MRPVLIAAVCLSSLVARIADAQVVSTTAGTSTLFGAHGGTVDVSSYHRGLSFGAGVVRGQVAMRARARFRSPGRMISVGDDIVSLNTPADLFGGEKSIAFRGVSLVTTSERTKIAAALGASAEISGAPFVQAVRTGRPVVVLSADTRVAEHLSFFTRNHIDAHPTAIGGATLQATPRRAVSVSAGLNAGRPYAALGGEFSQGEWLDVKGAYGRAGRVVAGDRDDARDLLIGHEGGDLSATFRRGEHSVELGHDRAWSIDDIGRPRLLAVVDRVDVRTLFGGVGVHVGTYRATRDTGRAVGLVLNANRTFGTWFEGEVEALGGGADSWRLDTYAVRLRQTMSPRVSLQQALSITQGHLSASIGGRLLTNPVTIDISHQTTATPAGEKAFVQSLGVDVRVNIVAGIQLHGATYVTPDGRLRQAISLSHVGSRQNRQMLRASQLVRLGGYLISGQVVDASEQPVSGAALKIGEDVVISDDAGRFFVRATRRVTVPFTVLTDQFHCLEAYDVVSAPERVIADPEREERPVTIRLAVRRAPSSTGPAVP